MAVVTSQLLVSGDFCVTNSDVSNDSDRPVPESVIGVDGTICSMLQSWVPENQEYSQVVGVQYNKQPMIHTGPSEHVIVSPA